MGQTQLLCRTKVPIISQAQISQRHCYPRRGASAGADEVFVFSISHPFQNQIFLYGLEIMMLQSCDGTLSSAEFYAAASAFSHRWNQYNTALPRWTWVPSRKLPPWILHHTQQDGYLSMENVILSNSDSESNGKSDRLQTEECTVEYEDEFFDAAVLVHINVPRERRYDFHVVYSASYRVPVLYFRAYGSDGQPLLLDDIEKDISVNAVQQLTRSKWTFMTQEEHPQLNRPWFMLHPCATSEWMKLLLKSDTFLTQGSMPTDKYIIAWFSVVGQVFGLKIPFEMLSPVGA